MKWKRPRFVAAWMRCPFCRHRGTPESMREHRCRHSRDDRPLEGDDAVFARALEKHRYAQA